MKSNPAREGVEGCGWRRFRCRARVVHGIVVREWDLHLGSGSLLRRRTVSRGGGSGRARVVEP
eukprot:7379345-Prymnesium_polylepis.1